MNLAEMLKSNGSIALVYGESGSGKTHFSSTFSGNIKIIAAESNGIKTLAKLDKSVHDRIDVELLPQFQERKKENQFEVFKFFDKFIETKPTYKTLVLDSITELGNYLIFLEVDITSGKVPSLQDYAKVYRKCQTIVRTLRDVAVKWGINVVILATENEIILGEKAKLHPLIAGKSSARDCEAVVDIVAHLEKGNGGRFFRLESNEEVTAKDRYGRKYCKAEGDILFSKVTGYEQTEVKNG